MALNFQNLIHNVQLPRVKKAIPEFNDRGICVRFSSGQFVGESECCSLCNDTFHIFFLIQAWLKLCVTFDGVGWIKTFWTCISTKASN